MALFLLEFAASARERDELRPLLDDVAAQVEHAGGEFIEAQVPSDLQRTYIVVEHDDEPSLRAALRGVSTPLNGIAQVRLVGASLDDIKAAKGDMANADYLVEWDFPAGLTMDVYLERKKAKAPLYAQVPEVRFLRTYVCEDMSKCLCFYQAADEAAVRRAREVVSTPIDRLARLAGAGSRGQRTAGTTGALASELSGAARGDT